MIERKIVYPGFNREATIFVVDEIESTMSPFVNMEIEGEKLQDWDVVIARSQIGGKGRAGRKWLAKKDETLCFSIALPIEFRDLALELNIISGYAICDVLREYVGDTAKVKWPNDVLVNKKKCSGILLHMNENNICMGVGININQDSFPDEIKDIATSIYSELGVKHEILEVLDKVLKSFTEKMKLQLSGSLNIKELYPSYSQYFGTKTTVHYEDGTNYSIIDKGIAEDGQLIAEKEDGTEELLISGVDIGINLYTNKK